MVELNPFVKYGSLIIVSVLNFFLWQNIAKQNSSIAPCKTFKIDTFTDVENAKIQSCDSTCDLKINQFLPKLRPIMTKGLVSYKADSLINIRYPEWTILMQPYDSTGCERIVNPHVTRKKQFGCLAVVTVQSDVTYNLLRYEVNRVANSTSNATSYGSNLPPLLPSKKKKPNKNTKLPFVPTVSVEAYNSTGLFENVANDNGRIKLQKKMTQFLGELSNLEIFLRGLLSERGLTRGDDVVVMVVNTGEIDLLANFVCSCAVNNISVHNVVVFAGSADIVSVIESFGLVGVFHEQSFAKVSKNANYEYLDPIFIDMMWYKSFSVWLLLKMRFNVLFQDVDVIWFRSPFQFFRGVAREYQPTTTPPPPSQRHTATATTANDVDNTTIADNLNNLGSKLYSTLKQRTQDLIHDSLLLAASSSLDSSSTATHSGEMGITDHSHIPPPDAYLSDDGQRSLRYAPFYANSGYYYLVANERTEYFAWSILRAFDLLHITGSHQNIFTIALMEGIDLSRLRVKLLTLRDFPSGVKFNHDKPFMRAIRDGHETPFMFHMCWTVNKYDKLRNFRASSMWYVREEFSEELGTLHLAEEGREAGEEQQGGASSRTLMRMAEQFQLENVSHPERWQVMANIICTRP